MSNTAVQEQTVAAAPPGKVGPQNSRFAPDGRPRERRNKRRDVSDRERVRYWGLMGMLYGAVWGMVFGPASPLSPVLIYFGPGNKMHSHLICALQAGVVYGIIGMLLAALYHFHQKAKRAPVG